MYTTTQIQCLQQLGIPLYHLKESITNSESVQESSLDWGAVSDSFIADVEILFPSAKSTEFGIQLTNELIWQLSPTPEIVISGQTLFSPVPCSLSLELKKKLWVVLSELAESFSNG